MRLGGRGILCLWKTFVYGSKGVFLWGDPYGTIESMGDHRIRLSDEDIALIVAALRSRAAMTSGLRRHRIERLATRLAEGQRGNPKWILDEALQTHEEDLDQEDA